MENLNIEDKKFNEIIEKLKPNIEKIANKYYIAGYDKEDIYQESYIGAISAIKYYDPNKNDNFYAFANLTIERRIIMLLKKSKRQKNLSLNLALSLDKKLTENTDTSFLEILNTNYSEDFIEDLKTSEILDIKKEKLIQKLSKLEKEVFNLYLHGYSYKEISEKIGKDEKTVDNALQRIKNKSKNIC